jgi:hypothetical protein
MLAYYMSCARNNFLIKLFFTFQKRPEEVYVISNIKFKSHTFVGYKPILLVILHPRYKIIDQVKER